MRRYQVAMYMRLSKEDGNGKKESNSIAMQRALLKKYVEENFLDCDLLEFCEK